MSVAILTACVTDSPSGEVFVRDSAGVQIVESNVPQWAIGEGWSVGTQPVLDLAESGSGAAHEFFQVRDAIRLADGRIAVADRGSGEVRMFSPSGKSLWAFGRQGEGPGEFQRLTSIAPFRGDSLIAFDYWLGRATIFAGADDSFRQLSRPSPEVQWVEMDLLGEATLVGVTFGLRREVPLGMNRRTYAVVQVDPESGALDTLTIVPGNEEFVAPNGDLARPLYVRNSHFAAHERSFYVGVADSMQVDVYDGSGTLRRIIRVPGYDLTLTAADLVAERVGQRSVFPAVIPLEIEELLRSLPDRATGPAYDRMIVDAQSSLWLREYLNYQERGGPTVWQTFDPDGVWLGQVVMPARFIPFEIGSDYILGVWRDPEDVEHVQVLPLDRRGGEAA